MGAKKKAAKARAAAEPLARRSRGRERDGASFPLVPRESELPDGYAHVLLEIKGHIQQARLRTVIAANTAMVLLYWDIGRLILDRQEREGWGTKVIERLAGDLRETYPEMKGFSARNLMSMRSFGEAYPDAEIVKQLVSQLPWGHLIRLLQRVKAPAAREWYVRESIAHGWSRSVLELQIDAEAHARHGKALTNFATTLPPVDSDMAAQVFKDPYLFDFLGTADPRREREIEQALVDHIQRFLLELGAGFAFVGRQVHLAFASSDFYVDLLFYHLKLRAFVVVELKAVPFQPAFVGQLNMYLSAVDDLLKHADDKPTIGLLLCRSKDKVVVEYALRDVNKPIGVAQWETRIVESLPDELRGSLPTVEEIEAELRGSSE
jgi:predicted nuclease of restriction endonuclease-like (RecB) superfamily